MADLEQLSGEIKAAGGQILVVTSESQKYANEANKKWKLPSLQILGDPSCSLARHLKASGLLDVFISVPELATDEWTARHPYMFAYTNGCAQPSTLVVSREKQVWFSHAVIPSRKNGGGAVDRPILSDVWREVCQTKLGTSMGDGEVKLQKLRKQTLFATPLPFVIGGVQSLLVVLFYRLVKRLLKFIAARKALRN